MQQRAADSRKLRQPSPGALASTSRGSGTFVWIESITSTRAAAGRGRAPALSTGLDLRLGEQPERSCAQIPDAAAPRQSHLAKAPPRRSHTAPAFCRGEPGAARLQQQRRLADAGVAADQRHRTGDQPTARETAVEPSARSGRKSWVAPRLGGPSEPRAGRARLSAGGPGGTAVPRRGEGGKRVPFAAKPGTVPAHFALSFAASTTRQYTVRDRALHLGMLAEAGRAARAAD